MELTEPIANINSYLKNLYGIDTLSNLPMWRVVFSEDELEKRYGTYDDYSPGGLFIRRVTEVREVPKYRQYIQERYILERLTIIPQINERDLPTQKLSYEPMFTFETSKGDYLPPTIQACKFVVDTVYGALGKQSMAKYTDEESQVPVDERLDKLQAELFGNETDIGDSLAHKSGVTVPKSYELES